MTVHWISGCVWRWWGKRNREGQWNGIRVVALAQPTLDEPMKTPTVSAADSACPGHRCVRGCLIRPGVISAVISAVLNKLITSSWPRHLRIGYTISHSHRYTSDTAGLTWNCLQTLCEMSSLKYFILTKRYVKLFN